MVGIAYTRANGTILEANRKFCEMLGYTATELHSLTTAELTHADDRQRHEQLSLELIGSKRLSISDEQRFLRKNGEPFWIKRMASRVEETSGQQPYLVEVVEDISARIDLEQRFRETFDHASVGIMHSSLDRRVLMINRKFCDMVGYSADELHQGSVRRIHHPEDSDADQHLEKRLVAGEIDSFSFEKRYVRKDGSVFWAHRTVSLARDEAGRPKYFIRVIEDISARKQSRTGTHSTCALRHPNELAQSRIVSRPSNAGPGASASQPWHAGDHVSGSGPIQANQRLTWPCHGRPTAKTSCPPPGRVRAGQ